MSEIRDAIATMGTILPDDVDGRDAVHVAVVAVRAVEVMAPGTDVGIKLDIDSNFVEASKYYEPHVGIVDPYLDDLVYSGERFWCFLYPRTITGLRHIWTHPELDAVFTKKDEAISPPAVFNPKDAAEKWLREFARTNDCPGFESLVHEATKIIQSGNSYHDEEFMMIRDMDAHGDIPREFWSRMYHYLELGDLPEDKQVPKYFTCSC